MKEPSASKLDLAALCAHPFTSGIRWPADRTEAGDAGNRVHRAIEAGIRGWPIFPAVLAGMSESERRPFGLCVEQATAYLAETGDEVSWQEAETWIRYHVPTGAATRGERGERRREPGWWTAILDHVSTEHGSTALTIRDWKTGQQEHTPRARVNLQLRLQVIAAATFFGASHVRAELVYLGGREIEVDGADFGPWALVEIAEQLRELRAGLVGGPTPPAPGPHCTTHFCPLRGTCAGTRAALASAYPLEDVLGTPRDEAHARWIFERLPGAHTALKGVEAALDEFARHHPIDLGDGRVYAWREKARRDVRADTHEQREALAQVLGVPPVTLKYETSIEAIEEAARAKLLAQGEKRGIKALTDRALDALAAAGGVKVHTYSKAEAFRPKA